MIIVPTNLDYEAPPIEIADPAGRLSEIIAARQFPGSKVVSGNDTFFQHRHNNEQLASMPEPVRQKYLDDAKAAGVSISGKVYVSQLARFNRDPQAWVSDTSEIKARCEQEGWTMEDADGNVLHHPKKLQAASWEKEHAKRVKRKIKKAVSNGR